MSAPGRAHGPAAPVCRGYAARLDVLGNRTPAHEPHDDHPPDRDPDPDPDPDLDADTDRDLDAEPDAAAGGRSARRTLGDLLSAESLAVAALATGAPSLLGSSWLMFLLFGGYHEVQPSPRKELRQRAPMVGVTAAVTLVPGLGALYRRTRPDWVRGVAGGAVLLGALLLALAAVFVWRSGQTPNTFQSGTTP